MSLINRSIKTRKKDKESFIDTGKDGYVMESLFDATQNGDIKTLKALLTAGADVNAVDYNGATPLMWSKNASIAKTLIEAGADVNAKDNSGTTALMFCSYNVDIANVLIAAGADVNAKDNYGMSALMWSCESSSFMNRVKRISFKM